MMNKKFCVVVIALIMLCIAMGAVFAQYSPTSCPAHHNRWRDGCKDCRIAQNNIEKNRQAKQQRLREQRARLAQKEREKADAETITEVNQIEQEIRSIRMIIIQIEADLD